MRIRLQRPRRVSDSCRLLAEVTLIRRLAYPNSNFVPRGDDVIINWGSSNALFTDHYYFNKPGRVRVATDKLATAGVLGIADVNTPSTTRESARAAEWLQQGYKVLARDTATGHSGSGITVLSPGDEVVPALYYSRYVPKIHEYRVHVVRGQVVDVQQKRRRSGVDDVSNEVRSAANGWVFCREEVRAPDGVLEHSIRAVNGLGLDYGAADTGYTENNGRACVYEVNTAPGLSDTTARAVGAGILRSIKECT